MNAHGVVLRAPTPQDADELRRQHASPEVRRWWGAADDAFPFEQVADTTPLAITVDDAPVGWIQLFEEPDPDARHASIDLFVAPEHHRRGYGAAAIATAVALLVERGHHRITVDPSVDNEAALACCASLGFTPVGVLHRAWRDPEGTWRDGLLMEWVQPEAEP